MPVWTLKTPQSKDPNEILRYLQELIQYLKYITEYLDEDNVPSLKEVKTQLETLKRSVAEINTKNESFEEWKTQVNNALDYLRSKVG